MSALLQRTLLLVLLLIIPITAQTCQVGLPDACTGAPKPTEFGGSRPTPHPTASTSAPTSTSSPPTSPPSNKPSISPSQNPSQPPTQSPSKTPTTEYPTLNPTTWAPTNPGDTRPPSKVPSVLPTKVPSINPTQIPSKTPSSSPSKNPSIPPTKSPSSNPSISPTQSPQISSNMDESKVNNDRNGNGIDDAIEFNASPAIAIEGVSFVLILVLFVFMLYHLFIKKKTNEPAKIAQSIKIPVLLTFISNIVAVICILILTIWIMIIFMDPNYETRWTQQTRQLALIPYFTLTATYTAGKCCLETFFILRVHKAFKGSTFSLSKPTVIGLFTWMLIKNIAWICIFFLPELELNINTGSGYLIVAAFEVCFVIFILFLFTKRLSKLLMMQKSERSIEISSQKSRQSTTFKSSTFKSSRTGRISEVSGKSPSTPNDSIDEVTFEHEYAEDAEAGGRKSKSTFLGIDKAQNQVPSIEFSMSDVKSVQKNLTSKQTELIFVITRCILLSGFAMITTVAFSFAIFFWSVTGLQLFILYSLWTIDMAMNCVCLYLNFNFATKLYKRCCGLCHKKCQNMFEYCTARKILKDHVNELEVQSITHNTEQI